MKTKILILIFSLIGFLFSLYLYYVNTYNSSICSFSGCNFVLNSKFSKTLGINNSLLGIFYFLTIGVLNYFNKDKFLKILSTAAAIFALYFIIIMLFVLKEICYYCLIIDSSAIIIFVLSIIF